MGDDVKQPMRGLGLSSLCLQEKKGVCRWVYFFPIPIEWLSLLNCTLLLFSPALVGAVSVAVEAILTQFSSSRTVVQKVSHCLFSFDTV